LPIRFIKDYKTLSGNIKKVWIWFDFRTATVAQPPQPTEAQFSLFAGRSYQRRFMSVNYILNTQNYLFSLPKMIAVRKAHKQLLKEFTLNTTSQKRPTPLNRLLKKPFNLIIIIYFVI